MRESENIKLWWVQMFLKWSRREGLKVKRIFGLLSGPRLALMIVVGSFGLTKCEQLQEVLCKMNL